MNKLIVLTHKYDPLSRSSVRVQFGNVCVLTLSAGSAEGFNKADKDINTAVKSGRWVFFVFFLFCEFSEHVRFVLLFWYPDCLGPTDGSCWRMSTWPPDG